MPIYTEHYKLGAFTWGDIYSSSIDAQRITVIDNQLAFLTDRVGEGVISGWTITDAGGGDVSILPGYGIINRRVLQTFGAISVTLDPNTTTYFYFKEKEGEIGGTSPNSNLASVLAIDTIAPNSPTGFTQVTSIVSYLASLSSYTDDFVRYIKNLLGFLEEDDQLEMDPYYQTAFQWTANTEVDFSHYKVEKLVGSDWELLGTTIYEFYADPNLDQDTTYSYRISAVDLTGNESDPTEYSLSTLEDTRTPSAPLFVQGFPGNERIEVIWDHSPSRNVDSYDVEIQPLDQWYNNDGASTTVTVPSTADREFGSTYVVFENLENNRKYRVSVTAVSTAGISSEEISITQEITYLAGAGEINDVDVEFTISTFENVGLETELVWRYEQTDSTLPAAYKFLVTFVENGTRFSEPIEVLAETAELGSCPDGNNDDGTCYELNVKYIPYMVNDQLVYESIQEYTPYLIIVQTADEDDNISNGFIKRIARTKVSETLDAVTDFSATRQRDNSIVLAWKNPTKSYFSHNLLTITITDLGAANFDPSAEEEITYITDRRTDKAETFIIPADQFDVNYRYNISITPVDVFGEAGEVLNTFQQFLAEANQLRPDPPLDIDVKAGSSEVYLSWVRGEDELEQGEMAYYKIYRANYSYFMLASSFSVLETVPATMTNFTDYTVTNGMSYSYFVTAVDIYGNESLNPEDDNYLPIYMASVTPNSTNDMSAPENLTVNASSNEQDAELSWTATAGNFDGYEILRSDGNLYSFQVVGYTTPSQTTYIDEDALLEGDLRYYYFIRKFKNETLLQTSSSSVAPSNSILIGAVTTSNGVSTVTIDMTGATNLANYEDPIRDLTRAAIDVHTHDYLSSIDKRIELRSSVYVSDWATIDYQTYQSEEDIEGASAYILQISGSVNEEFFKDVDGNVDETAQAQAQAGDSPVPYEVDEENSTIIFNSPLYTTCVPNNENIPYQVQVECPVVPYTAAPTLTLQLINITEVTGNLPAVKVGEFSATQVETGRFDEEQLPSISHDGRMGERLLPIRLPMQSLDNFVYSLTSTYDGDRNKMGTAVTFYDIIATDQDSQLLAGTSSGVWRSDDLGDTWTQVESFTSAVHKLFRSSAGEFFAITNYGIYKNSGTSFRSWTVMSGLEYVKVVRDMAEDNDGNLFATTDLGVFRFNSETVPYIEDRWEKLAIFGPRSSEAYAIMYDADYTDSAGEGRLLVSNELGLLQSTNEGRSWQYISELEASIKIWKFLKSGSYIFALADDAIYRKDSPEADFEKIAELDSTLARRMEIFNGTIYVSTNDGPLGSVSNNIYTDINPDIVSVWSAININNTTVMVTSINVVGDLLFIGTDRRVFLLNTDDELWMQYEQKDTVIPSVYVNNVVQKLGFYYNNGGASHNVSFDEVQLVEDTIEVANMYDIYYAEYGGWAHLDYTSKFKVYQNYQLFGESREEIPVDFSEFSNVTLPTYTDLNAHEAQADIYKAALESTLDALLVSPSPTGSTLLGLIQDVYRDFELFLSQLYPSVKSDFILPAIETDIVLRTASESNVGEIVYNETPVYEEINTLRNTSYTTNVNIVDGRFTFGIPFDRYDDVKADIFGVTIQNAGDNTHAELEDTFEYAYSGLPSHLSQVQQANVVKLGLFTEKTWPGQQTALAPGVQIEKVIPVDDTFYDQLNSTINYTQEYSNGSPTLSLDYPSDAIYSSDAGMVFVGGRGGVLAISPTTFEIDEMPLADLTNELVRDLFEYQEVIYAVTDSRIFYTDDWGTSWSEYNRSGLPNNIYVMGGINNNLLVGGEDGVYTKVSSDPDATWEKTVDSTNPVTIMLTSNVIFAVINGTIQMSSNGFSFNDTEVGSTLDITKIDRFGAVNTYVSSNQGLYSDNGTFNSTNPSLEEIDLGDLVAAGETVNDVTTNDTNKVLIAISDGSYGVIENDTLRVKEFSSLPTVHKVLFVGSDIWLFGGDRLKVPHLDYPIKLSSATPV